MSLNLSVGDDAAALAALNADLEAAGLSALRPAHEPALAVWSVKQAAPALSAGIAARGPSFPVLDAMSLADTAFVPLELPEVLIRPDGGRILPLKGLILELERMGEQEDRILESARSVFLLAAHEALERGSVLWLG